MPLSKIKKEFHSTFIAFGGGGRKTLGERDDIDQLAIIARKSNDPNLIRVFEVFPTLEKLQKSEVDKKLNAGKNLSPVDTKK